MPKINDYKYKLSIVIPMYNAEKYIANCLDSIIDSDLPKGEYEVVIVNDGSKDKGPEIAQKYSSKHNNFVYLTQKNQGQSVARNKGIEACHGEYVWCVDSDDIVCKELSYIFEFLKATKEVDIIKTKMITFSEGQDVKYCQLDGAYTHRIGRELLLEGFHPASLCSMIVRTSLIMDNDLWLIAGIVSEDVEFSHRIYAFAKHVFTFNYITYLYLYNPSSTTHSEDVGRVINMDLSNIKVSQSFMDFSHLFYENDIKLAIYFEHLSNNVLLGMIFTMIKKRKERRGTTINRTVLNEMKRQGKYPIMGKFDSFKKTIVVKLFNIEFILKRLI